MSAAARPPERSGNRFQIFTHALGGMVLAVVYYLPVAFLAAGPKVLSGRARRTSSPAWTRTGDRSADPWVDARSQF